MKLLFDIGSNVLKYTYSNIDLYDKIVAVEANPNLAERSRSIASYNPKIEILNYAVTNKNGIIDFFISSADTISTCDRQWIEQSRFSNDYIWFEPIKVPAITLDTLISIYGTPDLIKIDVESHEKEVIDGLSQKVPCLCFEIAEESKSKILLTIERLKFLGFTQFGYTVCDGYTDTPSEYKTWEDLGLEEQLIPERKSFWGMIFAK